MKFRDGVNVLTIAGSLISCAGPLSENPEAQNRGKNSCPIGSVYRDLLLYEPPEIALNDKDKDVEQLVIGLQRRIMFIAGQDKAEEVDDLCTTAVERDYCPLFEKAGVIKLAEQWNDAVDMCMVADSGAENGGTLDVECFLNNSVIPKDKGNKEDAEKLCGNLRYGCYRTAYITLRDVVLGR